MKHPTRRRFLLASASLPAVGLARAQDSAPGWLSKLEEIRLANELPALGGAIVTSEGLRSIAVTGVRKIGTDVAATAEDLWHLGSNTKAMTATLAAVAVEAGKIAWDTTVGEVFTRERGLKESPLSRATLTHLLSHWSGLPANAPWGEAARAGKDLRDQREAVLQMAIRLEDLPEPGEQHLYSNWGYVVAGHMLESLLKLPWEEQMRRAVFAPLGIARAGFGGIGTEGKVDQPWPHGADGQPMPKNGPAVDNLPVLGPAGTVHMDFADWAKFVAEHLAGPQGGGKLLKTATYEQLHTAAQDGEPYAYGWLALERGWGGRVLNHNGSNTMNYSVAWLAPEKDFALLACTNQGGDSCAKALDEVVGMLLGEVG